jgi:hypothetical protein
MSDNLEKDNDHETERIGEPIVHDDDYDDMDKII